MGKDASVMGKCAVAWPTVTYPTNMGRFWRAKPENDRDGACKWGSSLVVGASQ